MNKNQKAGSTIIVSGVAVWLGSWYLAYRSLRKAGHFGG